MFYGAFVLAKKGPLAKVWLAAHWDKKLTKAHVFETDVESTVDSIISPQVKMALRTSGHLLLGVVRIYSRKQKYLIHDLGEACAKIKMAFRPGITDLPSGTGAENIEAVTLPEIFHDFEASVANMETLNLEGQFTVNPSRASEITIAEDPSTTGGVGDIFGGFGELNNFDGKDGDFGSTMEDIDDIEKARDLTNSKLDQDKSKSISKISDSTMPELNGRIISDAAADFGGDEGMMDMFADVPEELQHVSLPDAPAEGDSTVVNMSENRVEEEMEVDKPEQATEDNQDTEKNDNTVIEEDVLTTPPPAPAPAAPASPTPATEEESFQLEHVEPTRVGEERKTKRKRRLVVDTDKEFSGQQIKSQFDDYKDLLQQKFFPPPTKKAMKWKEIAGCDQLFSNPTTSGLSSFLAGVVTRNYHVDIPGAPASESINDISELNLPEPEPELTAVPEETSIPAEGNITEPSAAEPDLTGLGEDMNMQFEQENLPEPEVPPEPVAVEEPAEKEPEMLDIVDFDEVLPTQSTEEQQSEELTEEFEQRRWTKRTQNILSVLQHSLERSPQVELSDLTRRCNRKQAVSRFYTCLLLAKEGMIQVEQPVPYGPITIQKGPKLIES